MVNVTFAASAAATLCRATYDYVIVGGGTAGLAVASRLTENPRLKVLVLEAGADETNNPAIFTAGAWVTTFNDPAFNWGFTTAPQTFAAGQTIDQPRGKLLGGCSSTNAMEWTLASKAEFDALKTLGNSGWDWNSLAPFFKKAQSRIAQTNNPLFPGSGSASGPTIGTSGPVKTSWNLWYSSLTTQFLDAVNSFGFGLNTAPESGNEQGVSNVARAVDNADCTRQDSAATYLQAASSRQNLFVLTGAQATKIVFGSDQVNGKWVAKGVQFRAGSSTFTASFSKEVIVSAGSFMTPQLLELSGIGKSSVLKQFGIKQLQGMELPVGENLQDHLMISMTFFLTQEAQSQLGLISVPSNLQPSGSVTPANCGTGTPFLWNRLRSVTNSTAFNDLVNTINAEINSGTLTPLQLAQYKIQRDWLQATSGDKANVNEAEFIFAAFPGTPGLPLGDGTFGAWLPVAHVHPLSRGSVHIQSSNPLTLPKVDPNYLQKSYDLKALRAIVKFGRALSQAASFGTAISGPITPPDSAFASDSALDTFIKQNIATVFHPVGTAAMVPKATGGVVDSTLVVYGTKNVRVVDASIIPLQFGATTMSVTYAIAEKAACMIQPSLSGC